MEYREQIVAMGHTLIKKNLVAGSWGNISCKFSEERVVPHIGSELSTLFGKHASVSSELVQGIVITPSGLGYEKLTAEDIVELDLEGKVVDGHRVPSSESKLHIAIYKACPEAQAIIHTHSIYACAMAAMRKPVPAIIEDMVQIVGGRVNCAEYALPGTQELADKAVAALAGKRAVLLANHGAVCWGKTLEEALLVAEILEKTAQIAIICQQSGGAVELSNEDAEVMHSFYEEHYSKRQRGEE